MSLNTELPQRQALTTTLSLDEPQVTERSQDALGNLPALPERHMALDRQMLKVLLDGNIRWEPIEENRGPGYRFTATGTFGRLLTGAWDEDA